MDLSNMPGRERVIEYKNKVPKKPLVSVCVTTYNHEKFIQQCLDSILEQQTDFEYEILLGEDDSTDKTRQICKEYANKYPDKIRLFLHSRSNVIEIGGRPTGRYNFLYNFSQARGKYIALCDGDDYWTDKTKLQRQVNYMERRPELALCFHPVRVFFENDGTKESVFPDKRPKLSVDELLSHNFIQTNSVMYRRQKYKEMAINVMPGDWYLHLYHAQFGKIGYIDRTMSVYRRHPEGIWWSAGTDRNALWLRYGTGHLSLYLELMSMFKTLGQHSIIIYNIEEAIKGMSSATVDAINAMNTVDRLKHQLGGLQKEYDLVINSKSWKLRNTIIKILRRHA